MYIYLDPGPHYFVLRQTDLRTPPLLRGMFLGTTLCLFSTKLLEDIKTPAERIIVPLTPVELVESFEFGVRDREVCTVSIAQHQMGFWVKGREGKKYIGNYSQFAKA